ncbi:response regulator transcription factor [Stenotrophomonas sp. CFBP8980]|jgi:two-component system capsular synthesis response regulator RcsB|uniref:response regulator transcription factor n=1 Tax=Stenotrophomonas sp. CFBP8980 TaxID=3096523 RepID=UPI002A6B2884|nr:response regulator transcription factor [Stenotrophomonas sp. CFBP8980]MDY1034180.1 response regulator transcription factor [Stenotrophomonas sp. CFBP8980]
MADNSIHVVVADDHPLIRMAVESALDSIPALVHVGSAADSTELIALLDEHPCDVLVTDYAMPGGAHGDGLPLLHLLRERYPELQIVVFTGLDQAAIVQTLFEAGISHILSKADDVSHIAAAITAAHVGRRYLSPSIAPLLPSRGTQRPTLALSPREREVLTLFVAGWSVNAIAEKLDRRKQTVSTQKVNGMAKLGIERDADLFKYAVELGLSGAAS